MVDQFSWTTGGPDFGGVAAGGAVLGRPWGGLAVGLWTAWTCGPQPFVHGREGSTLAPGVAALSGPVAGTAEGCINGMRWPRAALVVMSGSVKVCRDQPEGV